MKVLDKIIFILILILVLNLQLLSKEPSCIKLIQIDLPKNILFDKKAQNKKFKSYYTKCISSEVLKNILKDISTYYMDNGYITSKAYLKEQNITDGQIDIGVLEGIIEDIVHSETNSSSSKISSAFVFQKDSILNLQDIETSLESMNRVPSNKASFKIKPGNKQGGSIVDITTKKTTPIHLSFGSSAAKDINNENPNLTATLSIDNLLNINDIFSYTYNGSRIQKEYQSTKGKEFNYSFPLGSYIFEIVFSDTTYRQGVLGINDTYLSNGKTIGKKLKVSKLLTRNKKNKLNLSVLIYHKDTKNYFSNQLIEVSSYKTTLAQIDLIHTYLQNWGDIITTYSYSSGQDWFDARDDDYSSAEIDTTNEATLEFEKYSLDSKITYHINDRKYNITSNFHLQYTNDYLYNNDQLSIGSDYTVRGYSSSNLFGNNGWYVKNDFTKSIDIKSFPKSLQNLSIYLGLDYGEIRCQKDNPNSCGEIYGGAIGFKTSGKNLNTDFAWSRPFKNIDEDFETQNLFRYNLTINF